MEDEKKIQNPFDPSLIDVNIETINLGLLVDRLEYGEIDLQPEFQRSSDLWDDVQKSRLIESILLGLPLPSFYFSEYVDIESRTKKLQVIDGLQRLCSLRDFMLTKKLKLTNLQFLQKEFGGKGYDDLSRYEQMNIRSLKITVNTLRKSTPVNVKYVIFQRVNTAGLPLTAPEMRYALHQGKATKLLVHMSKSQDFIRATAHQSKNKDRMEAWDYVNRFAAFYLGLTDYPGDMEMFLGRRLDEMNDTTPEELKKIEDNFVQSMKTCYAIWGWDCFRKRTDVTRRRTQLSKSLFEAISVNVALLSQCQQQYLVEHRMQVKEALISLCRLPKFVSSISGGPGKKTAVMTRFEMIETMFKNILNNVK